MDMDNVQTILENYKSTIQDEDSSSEHEKEDHQHIQNIVQQTLDISRTLYSKPLTIFLPKNNVLCSNKGNALLATNLDTSRKTAYLKGNSKLFPITNPTVMKRIASPRKIIKRRK